MGLLSEIRQMIDEVPSFHVGRLLVFPRLKGRADLLKLYSSRVGFFAVKDYQFVSKPLS